MKIRIAYACGHRGWLEISGHYISKELLLDELALAESFQNCPVCTEQQQLSKESVELLTELLEKTKGE